MTKRDNGPRSHGSKHSALNSLRRNLGASPLDDGQRTGPTRFRTVADAADAAEDDYARFARRGQ